MYFSWMVCWLDTKSMTTPHLIPICTNPTSKTLSCPIFHRLMSASTLWPVQPSQSSPIHRDTHLHPCPPFWLQWFPSPSAHVHLNVFMSLSRPFNWSLSFAPGFELFHHRHACVTDTTTFGSTLRFSNVPRKEMVSQNILATFARNLDPLKGK